MKTSASAWPDFFPAATFLFALPPKTTAAASGTLRRPFSSTLAAAVESRNHRSHPPAVYSGIDAMGIFWSMTLAAEHSNTRTVFVKDSVEPNVVTLEALLDDRVVASASVTRHFISPGTFSAI